MKPIVTIIKREISDVVTGCKVSSTVIQQSRTILTAINYCKRYVLPLIKTMNKRSTTLSTNIATTFVDKTTQEPSTSVGRTRCFTTSTTITSIVPFVRR